MKHLDGMDKLAQIDSLADSKIIEICIKNDLTQWYPDDRHLIVGIFFILLLF